MARCGTRSAGRGRSEEVENPQPDRRLSMAIRKVDKKEWRAFLDGVSKALQGARAEIEVLSLALGDQLEAEWLPLLGMTYEPREDVVEVALEGVDHMIWKPREIYVDEGVGGIMSVEIVDPEGVRQIVKLREPLMLPAPA
jgi:hypothetical protein